jgi:hypothetical protein
MMCRLRSANATSLSQRHCNTSNPAPEHDRGRYFIKVHTAEHAFGMCHPRLLALVLRSGPVADPFDSPCRDQNRKENIMHGTHKLSTRVRAAALFGGAGLLAISIIPAQPASADLAQCAATLSPDTVAVGAQPVNVGFTLSEQIGKVSNITVDEGSGLRVTTFNPDESVMQINANSGVPGSWQVRFAGEAEQTCTGTISVKTLDR